MAENAKGADILLGVSAAGAFYKEILESLADDTIVFAMANPNPEATYADMKLLVSVLLVQVVPTL